ncbi:hypothetical protein HYPSUDRAFT_34308 [Hypholoma sublateritium FD-334 SS-4]|uniref:Uncharacterized protein n=1 Tax=Hypholoma sublateritium (strain FD-334 SS-4) TaxID=945553 RepID=A0A0D2MVM0_HYPSF|nr:hypothetical protein HYPSUDRAFT_34308 [Hypholoma sublateritium FD-334 SS-4]
MPRAKSEKRSRLTNAAKKPYEEHDLPEFKMQTRRRITYFDRVIVGFFAMRSLPEESEISLDDLMQIINEQAESNGEILGKRMGDYIEAALYRLSRDRFITDLPEDENNNINFMINPDFRDLLSMINEQISASDQFTSSSAFTLQQYGAVCAYFHDFLTDKRFLLDKTLTKPELNHSARRLTAMIDARTRARRMHTSPSRAPMADGESRRADCAPDDGLSDEMDIDTAPRASGSSSAFQTPLRKSSTLNQIGAYPSPLSLPRRGNSGEPCSESPLTPLRSHFNGGMTASGSSDEAIDYMDTATETGSISVPDTGVPLSVSLPLSELSEGNWTNDHISSAIASFSIANQEWVRGAISLFKNQNLKARSSAVRQLWKLSIRHVQAENALNKATASGKLSARTLRGVVRVLHQQISEVYRTIGQFAHRKP